MQIDLFNIAFYVFSSLAVLGGLAILLTRNLLYAAVAILISLLGVAAMYVYAGAFFVAITQILIYIGGVVTLLIFGIMLTARSGDSKRLITNSGNKLITTLICVVLFVFIGGWALNGTSMDMAWMKQATITTTESIGKTVMTKYLIPFEIAGVLLLVSLIGAAHIAGRSTKDKE